MTALAVVTGLVSGLAVGYALQRSQLCFHATFAGALDRRLVLLRGWLLAVAVAGVGLSLLFLTALGDGLNRGLAFTPVANVVGGVVVGVGMAVANSCVSGLFYKLGSGMLGAAFGIGGWVIGELAARRVRLPGPTLLPGGDAATIPGVLGVPRLAVAAVFLAGVVVVLRARPTRERPRHRWQWGSVRTGLGLGAATVLAWALAGVGGSGFGPSTVGASASVAAGRPNWWLLAFLAGIVAGGLIGARTGGGWWLRGESRPRYLQLATGGVLLGAGGWVAGGCNLGHGLSGVAQLNVSSVVVVGSIVAGIALTRLTRRRVLLRVATRAVRAAG